MILSAAGALWLHRLYCYLFMFVCIISIRKLIGRINQWKKYWCGYFCYKFAWMRKIHVYNILGLGTRAVMAPGETGADKNQLYAPPIHNYIACGSHQPHAYFILYPTNNYHMTVCLQHATVFWRHTTMSSELSSLCAELRQWVCGCILKFRSGLFRPFQG